MSMPFTRKSHIIWSLIVIAVLGISGYVLQTRFEQYLAVQEHLFDEK